MKSLICWLFSAFLVLLYIYSIRFTFLPITGKQLIAVVGLLLFYTTTNKSVSGSNLKRISLSALAIIAWGFVTTTLNGTTQYIYINQIGLSSLSCFFASYCLLYFAQSFTKSLHDLLRLIAIVVFCESILTIMIRMSPTVYQLCSLIQEFQFDEGHIENAMDLYRFFGLGNAIYFGVLPSCALGCASCTYLMSESTGKYRYCYAVMFVIIIVVSFLVTRYSLLVGGLCFLLYFWNTKLFSFRNFILIISVAFALYGLFVIFMSFLPDDVIRWAMSVFEKDGEGSSTGAVVNWWTSISFEPTTFLVGDGLYTLGDRYYKSVDVGFFRQIFYGGIVGFGLIIRYYYLLIKYAYRVLDKPTFLHYLYTLFACYLLCMAKGDLSMIDIFMLFFVYVSYFSKQNINTTN